MNRRSAKMDTAARVAKAYGLLLLVTSGLDRRRGLLFRRKAVKFIMVARAASLVVESAELRRLAVVTSGAAGLAPRGVLQRVRHNRRHPGAARRRRSRCATRPRGSAAAAASRRRAHVRARRHIGVLVRQDLRYTLSSARGLLFSDLLRAVLGLGPFEAGGRPRRAAGHAAGGFLAAWLFDANVARLLQERPRDAGGVPGRRRDC
jgi:hypothetical protein